MTDPAIYAAATVTVISALVGGVVSIVNAFSAASDRRASLDERRLLLARTDSNLLLAKETAAKTDGIAVTAGKIHELTTGWSTCSW